MTDQPDSRRALRDAPSASLITAAPLAAPSPSERLRRQSPATPPAESASPADGDPGGSSGIPVATEFVVRRGAPSRSPGRTPVPSSAATERPAAGTGRAVPIGRETARDSLAAARGPLRPLESLGDVLPEFEAAPARARSLWRHPATIVSIATTALALVALAVILILGALQPHAQATGLTLERTGDMIRATWSGPDVPYQLVVVGGPAGEALDVSQRVSGTEAWLPLAADIVDDRSCLVVRPAEGRESAEVSLDAAAVAAQGGASACVSGATQRPDADPDE